MPDLPDPIASVSPDAQAVRGSMWWAHSSNKYARQAQPSLAGSHLEKLLAAGEWDDPYPFDPKAARSMMAWRGLWSGPRFDLINQALDQDLAPPPSHLDWWARGYFRDKALKALFLPTWPAPRDGALPAQWDEYHRLEGLRQEVAQKIHARYPQLLDWFLASNQPRSLYSHPLIVAARPGQEDTFHRIAQAVDLDDIFAPRPPLKSAGMESPIPQPPLGTPADMLEIGLKRGFAPLMDLALEKGATVHDPVNDFKGQPRSLLHMAIASANAPVVDWILERQPNLEAWDRLARTPFLLAARQADVKAMEKLLAAGANPTVTDRFGQGAAHLVIEGIRTQNFNLQAFRDYGSREYIPLDDQAIDRNLTRAAQALAFLERAGVDTHAPCAKPPRATKNNPSPFADLPRAARGQSSAKAGETWSEQMERRCQNDPLLGQRGLAFIQEVKMDLALPLVPPEPDEGEEGPTPAAPSRPAPRARF